MSSLSVLPIRVSHSIAVFFPLDLKLPLKNIETSSFAADLFDASEKFYRFVYFKN